MIVYNDENVTLYKNDCLQVIDILIKDNIKFDAIITDPPYGTTACKWDSTIPFGEMWSRLNLLRKDKTPIVLFGSEPFSSALRISNIKEFKYDWVWNKKLAGNALLAKIQPLKIHEIISVFYKHNYYPIKIKGKLRKKLACNLKISEIHNGVGSSRCNETFNDEYYPKSIVEFTMSNLRKNRLHPTQKSIKLLEYLIKTYTKENDLILDFTSGSGTTLIAALNTNRKCIGIEKEDTYCDVTIKRIKEFYNNKGLFR